MPHRPRICADNLLHSPWPPGRPPNPALQPSWVYRASFVQHRGGQPLETCREPHDAPSRPAPAREPRKATASGFPGQAGRLVEAEACPGPPASLTQPAQRVLGRPLLQSHPLAQEVRARRCTTVGRTAGHLQLTFRAALLGLGRGQSLSLQRSPLPLPTAFYWTLVIRVLPPPEGLPTPQLGSHHPLCLGHVTLSALQCKGTSCPSRTGRWPFAPRHPQESTLGSTCSAEMRPPGGRTGPTLLHVAQKEVAAR